MYKGLNFTCLSFFSLSFPFISSISHISYASYALYISYICFLTVETNNTVCNSLGAYRAKYSPSIFSAV